ncbi:MAG: right-handed parallel beta-helix repeat-containing protein [Planctomycetes bacterium]|nr:right-handed parallel beta-helix repeat-containing protein [Planctomycetota bacterium]
MRGFAVHVQAVILALLAGAPALAGDRLVPSQYATIQAAIDAAQPYDRVLVAPGTYRERIVFRGIPLLVQSAGGAAVTTLHGGGQGPVVRFDARDGPFVFLQGFTITGGYLEADDARGAGIHCAGGSPVLLDNIVTGNQTRGRRASLGAGLYAAGGLSALGNEFSDNRAAALERTTDHAGGGIYAAGGVLVGNRVIGNSLISGCNMWDKVMRSRGAGAALVGKVVFLRNEVTGNHACFYGQEAHGGGLYLEGDPIVALNLIRSNTARAVFGRGGGLFVAAGSRAVVESNALVANLAEADDTHEGQGGGIYVDSGAAPVVAYNTFHGNRVTGVKGSGGGLMAYGASPRIVGCLFWKNTFWKVGRDERVTALDGVMAAQVSYSLVDDGQFAGTGGNFQAAPLLADAYHLSADSPCLDRGEPGAATLTVGLDIDGAPRPMDGFGTGQARADVGAHEFGAWRRAGRRPVTPGARVPFVLEVPGLAGRQYLCAASLGQAGIPLPPPDPRVVPLSPDFLVMLSLGQRNAPFRDFGGVLDPKGTARPELTVPAIPQVTGLSIHLAGLVLEGVEVRLVTNRVSLVVER